MAFYRILLRSLRRSSAIPYSAASTAQTLHVHAPHALLFPRLYAFSSAEEAAAWRRHQKRINRINPPLHALRPDPRAAAPRPRPDPNAPRQPDRTTALVGSRLSLHNRVQSLIRAGDLDLASAVARQAVFSRTRPTVFTCNAVVAAMFRAKRYEDAVNLFHYFFVQCDIVPNVVSYNFLIVTHCYAGRVDVALDVYRHIIANAPFGPSSVTFRHLTKGLVDAGRISEAVDLLREMVNNGHGADSLVYNNVIRGYLSLENLEKANELFDELKGRCTVYDGVVNATLMEWFFARGREKEAMESYKSYRDMNFQIIPATCNVLLEALLKHGKNTEAWALFDEMLDAHTPPTVQAVNSDTFNIMVNECFKLGKFAEALSVFKKAGTKPRSRPFAMDVACYNNIIGKCCDNGLLTEAEDLLGEIWKKSLSPDVMTYRTLIDAYFNAERADDALQMFDNMVESGLRVIPTFANRWLDESIKKSKTVEASQVLMKMGERDPKPDPTSYEIVIRALCNEGLLDMSKDLLGQLMRYNIGFTSAFQEFVYDAFAKEGRSDVIRRLLGFGNQRYATHWPQSGGASPTGQVAA